ncbi:hypothetical protein POSPLADRAFT_1039726 [Postia placenta MAD-698-R-SB12]|uniref:Uncharacterized protein n=1 Tax=Postia placenta MAD-698-R-SB12 TaxID=670580 RepID=A0A1X6N2A6_9APHY|nr:hypothetical protein POSPLADRAFT_1039726 [Postia placenta MAD-698-R-SB12]OSX62759.1 hypothetical protein POSPLADRAFT_1039726 [Postia placenta MAD-698-R-SB12]
MPTIGQLTSLLSNYALRYDVLSLRRTRSFEPSSAAPTLSRFYSTTSRQPAASWPGRDDRTRTHSEQHKHKDSLTIALRYPIPTHLPHTPPFSVFPFPFYSLLPPNPYCTNCNTYLLHPSYSPSRPRFLSSLSHGSPHRQQRTAPIALPMTSSPVRQTARAPPIDAPGQPMIDYSLAHLCTCT